MQTTMRDSLKRLIAPLGNVEWTDKRNYWAIFAASRRFQEDSAVSESLFGKTGTKTNRKQSK